MYHTYSMLLKIFPSALYTNPLSVQALESTSCLSYLSYATTAIRDQNWRLAILSCTVSSHYLAMTSEQTEDFMSDIVVVI
jgi:hypothetical protein